jgi:drug/metabolite transporter (DMT)-like permease
MPPGAWRGVPAVLGAALLLAWGAVRSTQEGSRYGPALLAAGLVLVGWWLGRGGGDGDDPPPPKGDRVDRR